MAVLVAAELAVLYLLLDDNGWAFDDNLSLALGRQQGFSWHWLSSNLFGHFEIAHRALFSAQARLMPFDYRWCLLAMLLMLGLAALLLRDCLQRLLGTRGWIPVLAAGYLVLSVVLIAPLQWWTSGAETFPTLVCDLLSLWAYLRYLEKPRSRWVALSAAAIAVGLLFYEKPAYMPLYLLLLRVLVLNRDLRPRAVVSLLWRERVVWASYAAVLVLYVVVRKGSGAGSIASGGSASVSQWVQFLRIFWAQALVPSAFGVHLPAAGLTTLQVIGAVALQLAVLAIVVASVRLRRRSWRAWLALVACAVATAALVGEGRLADFGPGVAGDTRYLADFSWLVPLLVCLAFSRRDLQSPLNGGPSPTRRPGLRLTVAAIAVALAYAVASVATAATLQRGWQGPQARAWEDRIQTELERVRGSGARPIVADGVVPANIVASAFAPTNRLSAIVPLYAPGTRVDGPLDAPLTVIDKAGAVRAAVIGSPAASIPVPGAGSCAAVTRQPTRFRYPRALAPTQSANGYYLLLSYRSRSSGALALEVRQAGGGSVAAEWVTVSPGRHRSLAWLGGGDIAGLALSVPRTSRVCVRRIDVVTLAPR